MRSKADFVEPMLLLRKEQLPDDPNWLLEFKFDGYRALAFKTGGRVHLRSRNENDFNGHYPGIVQALESMPNETVIDGEIVALNPDGMPSLQRAAEPSGRWNSAQPLNYYVFDLLILRGRDVMAEPLVRRRELLEREVRTFRDLFAICRSCLRALRTYPVDQSATSGGPRSGTVRELLNEAVVSVSESYVRRNNTRQQYSTPVATKTKTAIE